MALELYLVRHGIAEERGPRYPDDTKRPLTRGGMADLRQSAKGLAELGIAFDLIATSPLVRTRQTAEIIAGVMDRAPVEPLAALAPDGTSAAVVRAIAGITKKRRLALVGHEPNIGELAAYLIGSRSPLVFKKGAICRIDVEDLPPRGLGALRWFLPPRILRKLA